MLDYLDANKISDIRICFLSTPILLLSPQSLRGPEHLDGLPVEFLDEVPGLSVSQDAPDCSELSVTAQNMFARCPRM